MTILLVNGCSHTAGTEMEYANQFRCYEKAWPKWLADDMGWDWINLAQSGNSNEQIKRTTIDWIIENVELSNRYKVDELIVMIMWSGFNRFEAWNNQTKKLISVSGNWMRDCRDNSKDSIELCEYIKYRTIVDNNSVAEYRSLMEVYLTARYLESLNIKYYFMNALYSWKNPTSFEQDELRPNYKLLYDAYGNRQKRHLGFSLNTEQFHQYLRDQKIPVGEHSKWDHWGVEGHKAWKDHVKIWMKEIDND